MDEEQIVIVEPQNGVKETEKYTHRFVLKECPVTEVKIYNDRAEV